MHFVVRADSGIKTFADLAGKTILIGKGTFSATEGEKYLKLFGLEGKVKLADVELNNAVPALKNGQIDGFVTAGSFPAPNVIEAAAGMGVRILSLSDDQVKQTERTRLAIPANTYSGQKEEIVTTSLPVVAYTTTQMDEPTAYLLTRTFWTQRDKMAATAPWWGGVDQGHARQHRRQDASRRAALLQGSRLPGDRRQPLVRCHRAGTGRSAPCSHSVSATASGPASAPPRRPWPSCTETAQRAATCGLDRARRGQHRFSPLADLRRAGAQPGQPAAAHGAGAAVGDAVVHRRAAARTARPG